MKTIAELVALRKAQASSTNLSPIDVPVKESYSEKDREILCYCLLGYLLHMDDPAYYNYFDLMRWLGVYPKHLRGIHVLPEPLFKAFIRIALDTMTDAKDLTSLSFALSEIETFLHEEEIVVMEKIVREIF